MLLGAPGVLVQYSGVLMVNVRSYSCNMPEICQIVTKFGFSRHIVIKACPPTPYIKFHGNPSSESRAGTCGQTDVHDDSKGVYRHCERALKKHYLIWKYCRLEQ